jgi:hypothetical protein
MAWSSRQYRRNRRRRSRCRRWSRRRRRNVEWNGRTMERVQLIKSALPRLLGFGRRGNLLDFIVLIGRKVLIG